MSGRMVNTDYKIEAFGILLREDCLSERYSPLVGKREELISGLLRLGCRTKNDAAALPDGALAEIGLESEEMIRLFRRFLTIYDPSPAKFREIDKICTDPEEKEAYRELYYLPGVKAVRAALYFRSGYRSMKDFTDTSAEEVLERTSRTIAENGLTCIVPLPKEVRTHIAVAKAFTME